MALTPETLVRHELIGLHAAVVAADNPDLVGVAGRVVRETRNTLSLRSRATVRQVPKRTATFAFRLPATDDATRTDEPAADREAAGTADEPDGNSAGESAAHVTVDGATLLSRPARRTEDAPTPGGDDRWR